MHELIISRTHDTGQLVVLGLVTALTICASVACSQDASLPTVSTRRPTCPDPRIEPVVVPLDMDTAAQLVAGCSLDLARMRSEDERTFSMRVHGGVGLAIRNSWLRERDSGVTKALTDLGVKYPDDMSNLILSAAWHHVNDLPFDVSKRLKCWEDAWRAARIEPEVTVQTADGSPIPPPVPIERCYAPLPKPRRQGFTQ